MGEILIYILVAVVGLLVVVALYLLVRILQIYFHARRLQTMRSYETILYAALQKLEPEHTLKTLFPKPDPKALEEVLLRMGDEGAEDWRDKVIALYELGGFTEKRVRQLGSRLKSRRSDAARRLGRICDPGAVPYLKELLRDGSEEVEEAALYALGRIGTREALEAMMEALEQGDRWTQEKVAEAVEEAGDESRQLLLLLLRDESPVHRAFAAEVIGRVGGEEEADRMEVALEDPVVDVRARAADSLGAMRHRSSRPALLEALRDPAWEVRSQAVKALGNIGEEEDAAVIKEALRDEEWWVRSNAAAALKEMGEVGEELLVEALWDEDRFARETAAQALEESSMVERLVRDMEKGEADEEGARVIHRLAEIGCVSTICQAIEDLPEGEAYSRLGSLLADIENAELSEAMASGGKGGGRDAGRSRNKAAREPESEEREERGDKGLRP
ncbi:MAG: HEAT repeat domain-containing protein [Actinomycetota bacterium]|nr:HEAT repeat domain-containing protein [Actinomycetota bacterium]